MVPGETGQKVRPPADDRAGVGEAVVHGPRHKTPGHCSCHRHVLGATHDRLRRGLGRRGAGRSATARRHRHAQSSARHSNTDTHPTSHRTAHSNRYGNRDPRAITDRYADRDRSTHRDAHLHTGAHANPNTQGRVPSHVRFFFSLRNEDNQGIIVPAEELRLGTVIQEQDAVDEAEWGEIDTSETNVFVHGSERFVQEIVFVLDFSNSMSQARLRDGTGGIQAMMLTFFRALVDLPPEYRVGVVEFHDRNAAPFEVSEITDDRDEIRRRVSAFVTTDIEPGASLVRDAIGKAASMFTNSEDNPDVVRAVVFFSDARDTSSSLSIGALTSIISANQVQLFSVGTGELVQEPGMLSAVSGTGGNNYAVREQSAIHPTLELLRNDLRAQYRVGYVTLRREGGFRVQVDATARGASSPFVSDDLLAQEFFGPDIEGLLALDAPVTDGGTGRTDVFVRAHHIPRNIKQLVFRVEGATPVKISLVPAVEGGLLGAWSLSGPDQGGYYTSSSTEALDFGNFGHMFRMTFSEAIDEDVDIRLIIDNSVYAAGKSFTMTGTKDAEEVGPGP